MKNRLIKRSSVVILSMLVICLVCAVVIFKNENVRTVQGPVGNTSYLGDGDGIVIMDNGESDFKTLVIGSANHTGANQVAMQLADSYFYKFSNVCSP